MSSNSENQTGKVLQSASEEPEGMTADNAGQVGAASPYASGGGGTRLEHRLGAVLLARLLTGGPVHELGERPPSRVAFQQSPAAHLDDLVVTASGADGVSSLRLEIAVRRTPRFIRSDKKTTDLVASLVAADIAAENDPDTGVEHRLAVAVSGYQVHAQQLAELAGVARAQATADEFFALVRTPGRFASRGRLEQLRDMVAAVLPGIPGALGSAEQRCWSLLRRLWMMQTQLETGHEDAWTAIIDDLQRVAIGGLVENAAALRDRLEQLAGEFAKNAGAVDAATLRQYLHGQIVSNTHVPAPGWTRLVDMDRRTRSAVARSAIGREATTLRLPRNAIRESIRTAVVAAEDLVVMGESGVGKSALVMDTIEQLGKDRQALALNLRHLPSSYGDLLAVLLNPLDELLAELTAPERMLIIDSAEAAAEGHGDVYLHLISSARDAGMKVVAVTTSEAAAAVIELMNRSGDAPRELLVAGLDDEDLREAAQTFPALQRLVDDARARELLRRPIVIDLLCRSGDPGLPLSEAQALEHIWYHLVRNENRRDEGAPDAREQVMLRLADHAVRSGDVDSLLARLDHAAVDGLRRSGLLLPASRLPWERVPAFKHDLVRAYAVARMLLADRDPAAALTARGVPRWTLSAARLACEILLTAPDDPGYPQHGRLMALEMSFDALVADGHGQRWSDVPVEAVLMLPDAGDVLHDSWPTLVGDDGFGVARLIRVVRTRHHRDGVVDTVVAEPVISQLLEPGLPSRVAKDAMSLEADWLRAHVLHRSAAGQATRIKLRDEILRRCASRERKVDEQVAERQAALAARTPEEIAAADLDRSRWLSVFSSGRSSGRRRRRTPARHRPYLWIDDAEIEHLALLGPDLSAEGEAILRRIAEDEPYKLQEAVEALGGGSALAAYDSMLLLDLVEAYYIEHDEDDENGLGWSGGLPEDGIRDHRYRPGPLASYQHGPFVAMFRADYPGGVALLNRILDHAARFRVRQSSTHWSGAGVDGSAMTGEVLSVTGEPREYVGDGHVWLWYRGTGVGPYPCMSALQALEFVTEQFIDAGALPTALTDMMMADANSLAMPALALAVLVRHLEDVGDAIDPYLAEPTAWELEFSRATNEETGGLAARIPELAHPERRSWSLRVVSMMLALTADGERVQQLKNVGDQLLTNARQQIDQNTSPGSREHLAIVETWAAGLDRNAYDARQEHDHVVFQQTTSPDVERVLGDTNAELRRSNEAAGLVVRHAHVRDNGSPAPDIAPDALRADIALARDLLDNPPRASSFSSDGPAAVAATAIELHLTSRVTVPPDDLAWSATTLLQVAIRASDRSPDASDDSIFDQGADRSAARALPLLLLPAARELRLALSFDGHDDTDALITLSRGLAVDGNHQTRLAFARALDAVWASPCDTGHLDGRCHHRVAYDLVVESASVSIFGPWDQKLQRRTQTRLDPPHVETLDEVPGDDIYVRRLDPALRATGAAATTAACCSEDARLALHVYLGAHQRGMLASEHGYHHSDSDSLVAARAALWQASSGDDETTLRYVRNYLLDARLLAEGLRALAAAADERSDAGEHARRLWPQIMDLVLDEADDHPRLFAEHSWGAYARADLIPTSFAGGRYLTSELASDPYAWHDLLAWQPQVDRWVEAVGSQQMSLDHLVIAARELDVRGQIERGLPWIEAAVAAAGPDCAWTYTLPEWLHECRPDLTQAADIARWQRIVDLLVVAGDTRVADLVD